MPITQINYERTFNLGNYESERIGAVATVENGDIEAAYTEARAAVEGQRTKRDVEAAATTYDLPPSPPASDKQRAFIASLQDRLGWTSEQMGVYATEQGVDLVGMTKSEASALIDSLQKLRREEGIIENWAKPIVTPNQKEDIPF